MACPICSRDPHVKYRPFCSRRCADIDLGKWLSGSYAVPVEEDETWSEPAPQNSRDPSSSEH